MLITWTIMLTNGPLVGEAETETAGQAVHELDAALKKALGKKYSDVHSAAMQGLLTRIHTGERSWRMPGVWVEIKQ